MYLTRNTQTFFLMIQKGLKRAICIRPKSGTLYGPLLAVQKTSYETMSGKNCRKSRAQQPSEQKLRNPSYVNIVRLRSATQPPEGPVSKWTTALCLLSCSYDDVHMHAHINDNARSMRKGLMGTVWKILYPFVRKKPSPVVCMI